MVYRIKDLKKYIFLNTKLSFKNDSHAFLISLGQHKWFIKGTLCKNYLASIRLKLVIVLIKKISRKIRI